MIPRQVLQQLDLAIKVDYKRTVFRGGNHLVEKGPAGSTLLVQIVAFAHAGINQQANRQRKVRLLVEIADRLRLAVLFQHKIVFGEAGHDLAMLIPNGHRQSDDLHIDRESGWR